MSSFAVFCVRVFYVAGEGLFSRAVLGPIPTFQCRAILSVGWCEDDDVIFNSELPPSLYRDNYTEHRVAEAAFQSGTTKRCKDGNLVGSEITRVRGDGSLFVDNRTIYAMTTLCRGTASISTGSKHVIYSS